MIERKIYLVRHAKPELKSDKKLYIGRTDMDLSVEGIEEAEILAEKFKSVKLEKIYSSNLIRTQKTADIIGKYHGIETNTVKELAEINLGDWEGLSFDEVRTKYPDEYKKRGENIIQYCTPNGESFSDLNKRVIKAFYGILLDTKEDILIVGHAGVNRLILCNVLHMSMKTIFKIPQEYVCVNTILQKHSQLIVKSLNVKYKKSSNSSKIQDDGQLKEMLIKKIK